ncbi:MAG: deoxyguanosinetriphosphate triphosphohydrolase [Chloroflexota bacterium]|nr:deoxyguanosinetriphosphate triphosphohydrolase [Chloroflexota bacterium]
MFVTREQLENQEAARLAPYGMKCRESRGRKYPDPEHPYRTAYQRDRDRIIHTTAFRRLEYKTQVFVNTEGDYYRTRLTHTIEVAQIGRTFARVLGANEDLTEAICLVHDLGHPPFGHSGQGKLNELMKEYGGFDHQVQTLRIVEELEERFPDHPGLNLTYEVREGIAKHETEYDTVNPAEYNPNEAATLEAQFASAADETAYSTADLDDGLRAGILDSRDLNQVEFWNDWCRISGACEDRFDDLTRHRFIRWLVNQQVTDFVTATDRRLRELKIDSVAALRARGKPSVAFSDEMERKNRALKDYLMENFYRHYRVSRMAAKAEQVLAELFAAYMKNPRLLPNSVRARMDQVPQARAVCDYIAGMTDRFALQEHQRLFDPATQV